MSALESVETPALIRAAAELRKLREEQNLAMQKGAFLGMTEQEATEYKRRAANISELVKQLEMMQPRGVSDREGHHEQETQETARQGSESH